MLAHHHTQHYADRRHKVFEAMGDQGACLIPSSEKILRNGDAEYAFRQRSDLLYLTGWPEDNSIVLLLAKEGKRRYIVFCQESDEHENRWVGKRIGLERARQTYGADEAYFIDQFETLLPDLLSGTSTLYYPLVEDLWIHAPIKKALSHLERRRRKGDITPDHHVELGALLDELRVIKMGDEIARMRKAASISSKAHHRAMACCAPNMFEYQLEAAFRFECMNHGARFLAYDPIVASGENACVLHYTNNDQKMQDQALVLVDAGCEYQGYASDITRTYPVNGTFTAPQQAIYELVLAAQMAAIEKATPKHQWHSMQATVVEILVQGLVDLKILQGDVGTLIEQKAYMPYYMHQCGHWLGLDVHDVGYYQHEGASRFLMPGMLLTVEPGLYFPPDDVSVPEKYRGIGIRIEDDVLVTDKTPDVLSQECVKTVSDIQKLMRA